LTQFYRCLAHIVNLATQAFLSAHSKSKHYDPKDPEAHLPPPEGIDPSGNPVPRDSVGLIRAITVKVHRLFYPLSAILIRMQERSSAQRKQLFKDIQQRGDVKTPKQLLLDMRVRWSSTYLMLDRAESSKQVRFSSNNQNILV
jgi:hypothetical protein